ncbi:hypothetical protein [uncultured Sphingomonas sp.]|uniref:hypothetical protein n=1 Tax=uncultured Sphingomonas sp. TaxID=158754 RepID=UPI0025EBEBF3|nr:hypothetical protein [uncultured Sphingomonas sp.]
MPGSASPAPSRRGSRPLWFNQPGGMTGLSPMLARGVLALLILLTVIGYASQGTFDPVADRLPPVATTILDHVRHGVSFYPAALDALRENERALRPAMFAVPLPALFVTLGMIPAWAWHLGLMLLGLAMLAGWLRRVAPLLDGRGPMALAAILLLAGLYPLVARPMIAVPEAWAGVLIALSLVQRRPEAGLSAVALGLVAMILTPVALPYALVMLVLAARAGARREAIGWMSAIAVALLVLAAHGHALGPLVTPIDPAMGGPIQLIAPGTLIASIASVQAVGVLPMAVVVPLAVLAALGWTHWRQPVARRAGITLAVYALLALVTGSPAMVLGVSPLLFLGVVFAPDAVRELILAARGQRRRITVTRVVR